MLFNSPEFLLLFLPVSLLLFVAAAKFGRGRLPHLVLIAASMFFYAWWDWRYLGLLVVSTAVNYGVSERCAQPSKPWLITGIAFNVAVLGYFKYTDFAIENLNALAGTNFNLLHIVLPLGISFFTFQKIGYLVDSYQGKVKERDPIRFALFVMFFPQLIAGPIVHHAQIIPQLAAHETDPLPNESEVARGITLLLLGLFKKVVIADNIGSLINPVFANVASIELIDTWTAALGYTLQLYFDFSAYSEMALGIALLFGLALPVNFNSPYKATSITDFWRRWHITLGAFMRSYLYIPLGGNRQGMVMMLYASFATMLIGGLWHGAAWTFVMWGAMHATALCLHKLWQSRGGKMPDWLGLGLTLTFVIFAWVPFRAASIPDTLFIWQKMLGFDQVLLPKVYEALPYFLLLNAPTRVSGLTNGLEILALFFLFYAVLTAPNVHAYGARFVGSWRGLGVLVLSSVATLFSLAKASTFLYFDF